MERPIDYTTSECWNKPAWLKKVSNKPLKEHNSKCNAFKLSLTLALLPLHCPFFLRNKRLYNGIQVWRFFYKFKTPIHFTTMHYCNNFGKSSNVSISVNAYCLTLPPPGVKFLVVMSDRYHYLRNCAPTPPLTLAVAQILTLIRHGSILIQTLIRHRRSHLILMMTSV